MLVNIFVYQDSDYFIAKSLEGIASQGTTIQEALDNLKEAIELFYEDEEFEVKKNIFTTSLEIPSLKTKLKTSV